jgi:hypothetical protein
VVNGYALSLCTSEFVGNPTGRAKRDIPSSQEPLEKIAYLIEDVMTDD